MLLLFLFANLFQVNSQEKTIISKVNSATVFLNSAEVTRTKSVMLTKGVQTLKFINLSPFVDKKSIQVKAKGIEIQSVNFQKNYENSSKKSNEQKALESKLLNIQNNIDNENVNLSILKEEIQFLKENRAIGGKNQTLTVAALKEASNYYSSRMKILKTKELKIKNRLSKLSKDKHQISAQINDLTPKLEFPSGEIFIKIKAFSATSVSFDLTYNVSNVSWYPSYDIRVRDIKSPLTLVYKANVKQNSKVDWTNVKLRFSSANPSKSNKVQEIIPYFLDYHTRPPYYNSNINEVTGYVSDNFEGLPGATVIVEGTTIGTSTDFDGKYTIKIPKNASNLRFKYLGFKDVIKPITNKVINVKLEESDVVLEEVAIVSYGTTSRRTKTSKKKLKPNKAPKNLYSIPTKEIVNQTTVSFEIIEPYTIKSGNKDYTVPMRAYESPANYNYVAVPRIEENAFLVASLKNWEQFNLLEGEANIYFENTFIGTTLIDTRYVEKNLELSLGIDKNVTISRKKSKDFTTRQFIGNKKLENSTWDITIKNNKSQPIKMTVLDQIPISTKEEIKVTLDKLFNGILNKETGEVKWNFTLSPNDTKNLRLKYSVRYPKSRNLNID
ncbi:MAG: DUF4139 domain-containing protein [Flavobacteriaceae bacterium]